ncbi:tRNA (adenosine(37)-N6)-threonylcarbamoyltransferase complex dimerization subunit type 1 TsaB [Prolixibacteraceae bacterium JC049]|nr:tRNA (adenosine(37)-N6)-threonylcarbamoyltransferase complex dimerization subunit type 1 TsaB [Prolixibacteraceae bacterium JC049]
MALILNIESSTEVCSVALGKEGKLVTYRENKEGLNHATLLTVFVEEILAEQNISINDIDAIAVSEGPGSYTGLRIGVSAAKGLCYAAQKPLIAISPLQAMASEAQKHINSEVLDSSTILCPMMDARRMEVYSAQFDLHLNTKKETTAEIISEESFASELTDHQLYFFGNGAEKCKTIIQHNNAKFIDNIHTSARFMIELSEQKFQQNNFVDVAYFEPFYLKDFVAIKSTKNILKK